MELDSHEYVCARPSTLDSHAGACSSGNRLDIWRVWRVRRTRKEPTTYGHPDCGAQDDFFMRKAAEPLVAFLRLFHREPLAPEAVEAGAGAVDGAAASEDEPAVSAVGSAAGGAAAGGAAAGAMLGAAAGAAGAVAGAASSGRTASGSAAAGTSSTGVSGTGFSAARDSSAARAAMSSSSLASTCARSNGLHNALQGAEAFSSQFGGLARTTARRSRKSPLVDALPGRSRGRP